MRNIWIVASREFASRVKSATFIISTIVLVVSLSGVMLVMGFASATSSDFSGASTQILGQSMQEQISAQKQAEEIVLQKMGSSTEEFNTVVSQEVSEILAASNNDSSKNAMSTYWIGYAVGLVVYLFIMLSGSMIVTSVAEEKANSIAEVLLSTMKPFQLLSGKVLGTGLSSLLQIAIAGVPPLLIASFFSMLGAFAGVEMSALVIISILFILVGYFCYAALLAAMAAMVKSMKDVQNVQMPVMMVSVVGFALAITGGGDSLAAKVSQYVPLFSPFGAPSAFARGDMALLQVCISLGISVVAMPVILWVAGKLYSNSILNTGSKLSFAAALKRLSR